MSGSAKTRTFLFFAVCAILGWEFYALSLNDHATISEAYWAAMAAFPPLNILVGMVIGHWAWQRAKCRNCGERPW